MGLSFGLWFLEMRIIIDHEPGTDHVWALKAALAAIENYGKPTDGVLAKGRPFNVIEYTLMGGDKLVFAVVWNKDSVRVWRQT